MLAQTVLLTAEHASSAPTAGSVLAVAAGWQVRVYGWTITDVTGGVLKLFFASDTAANRFLHMNAAANGGATVMLPEGCCVQGEDGEDVLVTAPGACKVTIYYNLVAV